MDSSDGLATCRTCGARIRWTTTEAGAPMAVDAEPSEDGNTLVYQDATGRWRSRRPRSGYHQTGYETRHKPHVATCTAPRVPRQRPAAQRTPRRGTGRYQPWRRLP